MPTSEIDNEDFVIPTFEDLPEDIRRKFKERQKAHDAMELQDFLTRFNKNQQADITRNKLLATLLPATTKVIANVSKSAPPSVYSYSTPQNY